MKKTYIERIPVLVSALLSMTVSVQTMNGSSRYEATPWLLTVDENNGGVSLFHGSRLLINHNVAHWGIDSTYESFADLNNVASESYPLKDSFGEGITVTVSGEKDSNIVTQRYYLYKDADYILTDFTVSSNKGVTLNFMAPVFMSEPVKMFQTSGNNILFVPFDNDAWVRYRITPFGSQAPESYEVSAMINRESREGIIVGSVEHDTWKTGIRIASGGALAIDSLKVYGGATSELTRDVKGHGAVRGTTVKSPKIMIGHFDDWRDGMEKFADICNMVAPQVSPLGNKPFGWNSWGKIQTDINFDNASQTSEFFHENLQSNSFASSDTTVYVGLDSFWDCGFNETQLRDFADLCHRRGQKAGIYFCPFTDWIKHEDAVVEEAPEYRYKDIYLRHNDSILNFDGAYAIDPTHPATKERIKRKIDKFIEWGYDFLKIDFMAHGAFEADRYHDSRIMTGIQAYSHGMAFIDSIADGHLWINLSIAPLFPANYAHSRRIGCDAWADIKNTEYTLNALTYGWWLDHMYLYNDADHIVMEDVSDGENRARLTSSAITGLFFLGDDLSHAGTEDTKNKVINTATNPDINEMARHCKSFRPVELGIEDRAADMYYYVKDDVMYLAMFNFSDSPVARELDFKRLGLRKSSEYAADELWSHTPLSLSSGYSLALPPKDVKVLRINL